MTVEEKAERYIKNGWGELNVGGWRARMKESFVAGHKEALRWRDPEKELPKIDEMVLIQVQIRYTDTIVKVFPSIGILSECGLTHKMRLVDTHRSNGLIIGWRPIE